MTLPEDNPPQQAEEILGGHFRDADGQLQQERRRVPDRRGRKGVFSHHERRELYRRKADRDLYEHDHRQMIEDALTEFAAEHDPHHPHP